jgi:hypothetical protein
MLSITQSHSLPLPLACQKVYCDPMFVTRRAICALGLSLGWAAVSQAYDLRDLYAGDKFLEWIWETMDDPTHGRVNYVDKSTALRSNLSYSTALAVRRFYCYPYSLRSSCQPPPTNL